MTLHPVADDGGELPNLKINLRIRAGGLAKEVFLEPRFQIVIAWIETAVDARLREDVDVLSDLSVEEEPEARIKEEVVVRKDQTRSRLVDEVSLDVKEPTELHVETLLPIVERERFVQLSKTPARARKRPGATRSRINASQRQARAK